MWGRGNKANRLRKGGRWTRDDSEGVTIYAITGNLVDGPVLEQKSEAETRRMNRR